MNTNIAEYQNFFVSLKKLYTTSAVLSQSNIDLEAAQKFFKKFKTSYTNARQQGCLFNIWELVKIDRHELANCSILAWLLDCNGSHGQRDFFCRAVLSLIGKETLITSQYSTITEDVYYHEENTNRVDIVLENNKFCIFIEVKIDACEQPKQRERYLEELKKKNKETVFIYLTPYTTEKKDTDVYLNIAKKNNTSYSHITWNEISNALLEAMQNASCQIPELIKTVVQQYCCHIKNF